VSEESDRDQASSTRIRASDEDREQLIADLNEHMAAGRLDADELDERVQAAYAAKTRAELDALRRDLPATRREAQVSHTARRAHLSRRLMQQVGGSVGLFLLCTAIWLASGAQGQFWPVWVLIVVLITCGRSAWALYGPAPDLDTAERHLDRHRDRRRDRRDRRRLGP
jgi:hypothetical protein